ncbi:hypothetical protein Tco_0432206 [Tanacetum coccineum]
MTNTPYPSRKIRRIRACTHQRPQRKQDQYVVSREDQYVVLEIWNEYNILEDIKHGPYSKKSPIRRIQSLDTPKNDKDDDSEHEADDDIGYHLSDVAFTKWLGSKFFNYKTMDHYTMKALWSYWIRGDDEVELTDEESSNDKDEVAKVFRIDTNLFNFETPMCKAFKEFYYLLQIDPDLLTKDIEGFKTYEDYKDDWIYEWNKDVPWVDEKPWTNAGVWTKPTPDYEWYEALEDSEFKDEALRNKSSMEVFIKEDDDESRYVQKRRWNIYTNYDDAYEINHGDNEREELCEVNELSVCNIRRYMMIKYSFNNDEEYVAVKDDEYDDLTITREECKIIGAVTTARYTTQLLMQMLLRKNDEEESLMLCLQQSSRLQRKVGTKEGYTTIHPTKSNTSLGNASQSVQTRIAACSKHFQEHMHLEEPQKKIIDEAQNDNMEVECYARRSQLQFRLHTSNYSSKDLHHGAKVIGNKRPDIMFASYVHVLVFELLPNTSHLNACEENFKKLLGQVLWMQKSNDWTMVSISRIPKPIDNESTIFIMKNPGVLYEKSSLGVKKIQHIDFNVADLLTKAFDGPRYALTHNPTIHDSLVKQFWQTATASTLADGTLKLRATIDTLEYTITEASLIRSQKADQSLETHNNHHPLNCPTVPYTTLQLSPAPIESPPPFPPHLIEKLFAEKDLKQTKQHYGNSNVKSLFIEGITMKPLESHNQDQEEKCKDWIVRGDWRCEDVYGLLSWWDLKNTEEKNGSNARGSQFYTKEDCAQYGLNWKQLADLVREIASEKMYVRLIILKEMCAYKIHRKEIRKRTGVELQTESSKNYSPDTMRMFLFLRKVKESEEREE